jgi:integrase
MQSTFKDYLISWLSSIKASLSSTTWYQYEMTVRKHIVPTLGSYKLINLRPEYIQNLYNLKLKSGTGTRTIEVIHTVMHKSFSHAVKLGAISRNPVDATTPPRSKSREMEIFSETEVTHFLFSARGTHDEALYRLAIATGLRQSELLGLRWSDLDWKNRSLCVQRQLKRNFKVGDYYATPKTRSGTRTIALGERSLEVLRKHMNRQENERKAAGHRWRENDMVFPSSIGTPMSQRNLYRKFKEFLCLTGLPEIRFHDLRHTSASLMLNHGIPAIIVSRRLGHSKVSTTLDIYGHLIPEMQSQAAELIDELITPIEVELHTNCTRQDGLPMDAPQLRNKQGSTSK